MHGFERLLSVILPNTCNNIFQRVQVYLQRKIGPKIVLKVIYSINKGYFWKDAIFLHNTLRYFSHLNFILKNLKEINFNRVVDISIPNLYKFIFTVALTHLML